MKYQFNDGGRKEAGYKGTAGDCAVRAIAIATEQDYQEVYEEMHVANLFHSTNSRSRVAKEIKRRGYSPRNGMFKDVVKKYMDSIGWNWTPTMGIGTGCKVHLRDGELPMGRLVVNVSKHYVAVIDGVIQDTYDPSRGGTRCVYGYWTKEIDLT